MNTYLRAAQNLTPADLDEKQIAAAGITYLEGICGTRRGQGSVPQGAQIAHGAGRRSRSRCRMRSASGAIATNSST